MNPTEPTEPTSGRRPQRNAEATRADLLHAARNRFAVLGYGRTTTRDIAADAGVNVALIARYFGSKDGLFAEVVAASLNPLTDGSIRGRSARIDRLIRCFQPEVWPDYIQEHPILLALQDAGGDEQVNALRLAVLTDSIQDIAHRPAGTDEAAKDEPGTDEAGRDESGERLRADLVVALVAGVALMRRALPGEPVATAEFDQLQDALRGAITAILGDA